MALPFMAVVWGIRSLAFRSVRMPESTPRLCRGCTRPPARTVRRWEFRGITARRGEVDGGTPFSHLLAAADRGVQVRLLFRADNLAGGLVQSLQSRGVDLGTLTDLHAKFRIRPARERWRHLTENDSG